jgi:hypothetical protein
MKGDGSSLLDQDFGNIVSRINSFYLSDAKAQSNSTPNTVFRQQVGEPMEHSPRDILSIKDYDYSHPNKVIEAARNAKSRVYFSNFPKIKLAYCIVDNKFYYWKFGEKLDSRVFVLKLKGTQITAAALTAPDEKIFFAKNVETIIVLASDEVISIYPILVDSPLFLESLDDDFHRQADIIDRASVITDDFHRYNITTIATSSQGDIFAGSSSGWVYRIYYVVNEANVSDRRIKCIPFPCTNGTGAVFSYIMSFFPFSNPIICLSYDETSQILAALHENSNISFYRVSGKFATKLDPIVVEEELDDESKIIKLISVPLSDQTNIRFVGVSKNGQRYFFEYGIDPIRNEFIFRISSCLNAPKNMNGEIVLDFQCFLGFYAILTETRLFVFKYPYVGSMSKRNSFSEEFACVPIPETCLSLTAGQHILSDISISAFKNPFFWQHIMDTPMIYLSTVKKVYEAKFLRPVDIFEQGIRSTGGNYTPQIRNWMDEYEANNESPATAILLASITREEEIKRKALFVLCQFAKCHADKRDDFDTSLPPSSSAFLLRVARILDPIWHSTVFVAKDKKSGSIIKQRYGVQKLYQELGVNNVIVALEKVASLIPEYLKISRTLTEQTKVEQIKETSDESTFLYELNDYIKTTIEAITFIGIIMKQKKSAITLALSNIDVEYKRRLTELSFGTQNDRKITSVTLFESLREFATKLITTTGSSSNNQLSVELREKCPSFFNYEDEQLISAIRELLNINEYLPSLERIIETILKYITRPINLGEICKKLISLKDYKGVIDIVLRRAAAIDPAQQALSWFKGGRQESNILGCEAFDRRYACYEHLFEIINEGRAFDMMMATNDELFHICLYQRISERNMLDRLLTKNNTFIVPYLTEFAPDQLWRYYEQHKEYDLAAKHLIDMAKAENDTPLLQRIEWLQKVTNFASNQGTEDVYRIAKLQLSLAVIQKELMEKLHRNDTVILDQQVLLEQCCKFAQWNLALRILGVVPVEGDKPKIISTVWSKMLFEQFANMSLSEVGQQIIRTIKGNIDADSEVISPKTTVPILENFKKNQKDARAPLWAVKTILECGVRKERIIASYFTLIDQPSLNPQFKAELIYAAAYLAAAGADADEGHLKYMKDWFIKNGTNYPFYSDASKLLSHVRK